MRSIRVFCMLTAFGLWNSPVWGQSANSATVIGRVTDPSGAAIPASTVTLKNSDTNAVREQATNEVGEYTFPNVAPGRYTLNVTKTGFESASTSDQQFSVNNSYTQNIVLKIGQSTETVQVTATETGLQTTDAQIGNVIQEQEMIRLPTLTRNAAELLSLQPGSTPSSNTASDAYGGKGGQVSGARVDQNQITLDGIDITNQYSGGSGSPPVLPLGVDSVAEFRVGVSNPNATFSRASGGQVTVASRSGANAFHGVAYYYLQNSVFNANTWDNNRLGIARPTIRDNRGGVSFGGPIKKDKTFFFVNYEPRRFFQSLLKDPLVPSQNLRNGIITLGGVSYNLATSTACGAGGNLPCDPRGIGVSPASKAIFNLYPQGNDFTVGDGVNTIGYKFNAPAPLTDDTISFRLDHRFSQNINWFSRYQYSRDRNANGYFNLNQVDVTHSTIDSTELTLGDGATSGLDWIIRNNLVSSFRFGWIRERTVFNSDRPSALASQYNLPGTTSTNGPVLLTPGFLSSIIAQPVAVDGQTARHAKFYSQNIEFKDDLTWTKGSHTIAYGADFQMFPGFTQSDDKLTGFRNSLQVTTDADTKSLFIPPQNRPPGLSSANQAIWDKLYAISLGLVDDSAVMVVRDANLNPLPVGTPIQISTMQRAYYFYLQDSWRIRPTFTLTYSLSYGWQSAPTEKNGQLMTMVDPKTGASIDPDVYLHNELVSAQQGQINTPAIGYEPYGKAGLSGLWKTDYGNLAPRVAFSWSPSSNNGFLSRVLGQGKTVIRGGYGIVYDRVNVSLTLADTLASGYSQITTLATPLCSATGVGGTKCGVDTTPGGSGFRVGVDGSIPLPPPDTKQSVPVVPANGQGQWDYVVSPNFKTGKSHLIDFSLQRELPKNLLVEAALISRLGRNLPFGAELTQVPYMFKDTTSGQTFAQAYDASATALRQGVALANIAEQPFFANQFPKIAGGSGCPAALNNTQCIISQAGSVYANGNLTSVFTVMDNIRTGLGLPNYANHQATGLDVHNSVGFSNYNALTLTLRNRGWHGLVFQSGYTYSKSLDTESTAAFVYSAYDNGFYPSSEYGPSGFDRRHIFNTLFSYSLPFGKGDLKSNNKFINSMIGGWYLSGIFQYTSGVPVTVTEGDVFGGSASGTGAISQPLIPLVSPSSIGGSSIYSNIAGSGSYGTTGNPAKGGSGLNLFADPAAAFASFRPVLISQDTRTGRSNPLYGLPLWNQDLRIAKETAIKERMKMEISADFFNLFNNVNFATPTLSYTSPATFGVVSAQFVQGNRLNGSRWIQMGLRISF